MTDLEKLETLLEAGDGKLQGFLAAMIKAVDDIDAGRVAKARRELAEALQREGIPT